MHRRSQEMEQTHINKVLLRNVGKLSRIDEREESMMPKVVPSCGMTRTHTYSYENMERNVRQKIKNRSLLNLSGFHYCNRVGNFSH